MLLKEFISNAENKNLFDHNNKGWVDYANLFKHFANENIPGKICEEWKNFDTSILSRSSWTILDNIKVARGR